MTLESALLLLLSLWPLSVLATHVLWRLLSS